MQPNTPKTARQRRACRPNQRKLHHLQRRSVGPAGFDAGTEVENPIADLRSPSPGGGGLRFGRTGSCKRCRGSSHGLDEVVYCGRVSPDEVDRVQLGVYVSNHRGLARVSTVRRLRGQLVRADLEWMADGSFSVAVGGTHIGFPDIASFTFHGYIPPHLQPAPPPTRGRARRNRRTPQQ